jgi:hypothetical protein
MKNLRPARNLTPWCGPRAHSRHRPSRATSAPLRSALSLFRRCRLRVVLSPGGPPDPRSRLLRKTRNLTQFELVKIFDLHFRRVKVIARHCERLASCRVPVLRQ